jgi:hypothetical protein
MQECVHAAHITCMFENMSKWWNQTFLFRNHLRCFKVKLTPCVKSTRETTTLAGLQFSTPRKMWRIGPDRCDSWFSFGKRSQLKQFRQMSTQNNNHHLFTQDLSLRHYATPTRQIWQYLWHKENGEVRLWQFGLDSEGVIRCFRDEMISPPFEYEWKTARSLFCNYH